MRLDISNLMAGESTVGDDEEDTQLLRQMNDEARAFIESKKWCKTVRRTFFGGGIGGIIAAFLVEIVPAVDQVDEWLWVVVGDIPPAYLVTDEIPNAEAAIAAYVELMFEWVKAVNKGLPVHDLIPVNVPPTAEWAASLTSRIETIKQFGLYEVEEKG
jgi:hypothetical protein